MKPRGPVEHHYAIALNGTRMTFECKAGHRYTQDLARKKAQRGVSLAWWQRMLRYWSRENGGVQCERYECPKCRAEVSESGGPPR